MKMVIVGADVGQRVDPSTIAVVEPVRRELVPQGPWMVRGGDPLITADRIARAPAVTETVFRTRHLERLELGTPYPQVATRIAQVCRNLAERWKAEPRDWQGPWLYCNVDGTGVGAPVVELVQEALRGIPVTLTPCLFTHGQLLKGDPGDRGGMTVGKAYLVSRLQVLFQTGCIELPKDHPEAEAMMDELLNYEIKISETGTEQFGAFKVGSHDDLVTALGLACLVDPWPQRGRRLVAVRLRR